MGFAKNQLIEHEERGFGSIDKVVCAKCLTNYALKQFIINNGNAGSCDYCDCEGFCANVEDLINEIMDGLFFEYENAIEVMGIENGEFVGSETWDTYDLLISELIDEMGLNSDLLTDILATVNDIVWCKKEPYRLSEGKEKSYLWYNFSNMLKTRIRYVFFQMKEINDYEEEPIFSILDYIGRIIKDFNLVKTLKSETKFYRGRMHGKNEIIKRAEDLSSPPHNKAKSNRMSAEGISIFYGAANEITAVEETRDSEKGCITIATFHNIEDIQVIDLTEVSKINHPSLFDKENRHYREPLAFLRDLESDLSRPIEIMKTIEYIPAQVFAEYFRFLFSYNEKPINGIMYRSAKVKNGICSALFFDQNQCISKEKESLYSTSSKQMLALDSTSIKTMDLTGNK